MPLRSLPALALPGALTVYFAFNAGGFFAGSQAAVAVAILVVLAAWVAGATDPFAGISRPVAVVAAALGLYAVWVLLSSAWSDSSARALLEFDRVLLYLAVFVLFGSLAGGPNRLRWMLRLSALGIVAVCGVALITRLLPELWPIAPNLANDRLSYPITYWNALGLLAALGLVFCASLTSSGDENPAIKSAAAAALPVLAVTLFFTFSRGAIAAAGVGLFAYLSIGRPSALVRALLAVVPTTGLALVTAYGADLLATRNPTSQAAAEQGNRVFWTLAAAAAAAALIRLALTRVDRVELRPPRLSRGAMQAATAGLVSVSLGAAVFSNAPAAIGRQYERFVGDETVRESGDLRRRLSDPSNNNRLELWRVSLEGFESHALTGEGAGTFQTSWAQRRPDLSTAVDAHSLYLEVLSELGVVGLLLLLSAVATMLAGVAMRCRGPDRPLYAAVLAAGIAWTLHTGLDWDWEMPVVTVWFFALAGTALAAARAPERIFPRPPARLTRLLIGLAVLLIAVSPGRIAVSQARLNSSAEAFRQGDCRQAIDSALSSVAAVGARPEPYEIIGYCDIRLGLHRLAIRSMRSAVARDPDNWEFRYGLAVALAAAGSDPRDASRQALRLNPRGLLTRDLALRFRGNDPARWRERALRAPLPGDL